ncbi:unnamed protein product, partial [Sphacelaria rigidula]
MQVMARMWVRNGGDTQNQATSYASPSLCRHMRDLDMTALQTGCLNLGAEWFLGLVLNKFHLEDVTLSKYHPGKMTNQFGMALPPVAPGSSSSSSNSNEVISGHNNQPPPTTSLLTQALAARTTSTAAGTVAGTAAGNTAGTTAAAAAQSHPRRRTVDNDPDVISAGARLLLAEECLTFIIALLTELPRPAGRASTREALRREIVHRLASSECTHSEVSAVMANMAEPDPEDFLDDVLHEVGEIRDPSSASRANASPIGTSSAAASGADAVATGAAAAIAAAAGGGSGSGATKYSLKASADGEYDPTFVRLNRTEHQVGL